MWDELGIDPSDDPKIIRRAYAARLKKLDPDSDPAGFARLRDALEAALASASGAGPQPEPPDDWSGNALDLADQPDRDEPLPLGGPSRSGRPAATEPVVDRTADWPDASAEDDTLLDEFEAALDRHEAATALNLYYRASATGAIGLHAAPPLLDRLFALVLEQPAIDRAAFRELARTSGWDKPADEEGASDVRRLVLARLAAEDWYDSLVALAERRGKVPRKKAKLARLVLGRIGKYRMPRVDRNTLKSMLDEYRTHERWLSDRIEPGWVRTLERRWRRREVFWGVFFTIFLAAILLDWLRLVVDELMQAGLSAVMVLSLPLVAFLLWILRLLVGGIRETIGFSPGESRPGPPDDPQARLAWLEQQAEAAYEAMYGALGGTAAARYNDAKEFLQDAIALARRLGHVATAERLSHRLAEIKAVHRSQFIS